MDKSVHRTSRSKLRSNKSEIKKKKLLNLTITKAFYLGNFSVVLFFNNGIQKIIDFHPIFSKYLHGDYAKYKELKAFKKFIVKNGNIFWGKNEDVIFPVDFLYNHPSSKKTKEEILYVL